MRQSAQPLRNDFDDRRSMAVVKVIGAVNQPVSAIVGGLGNFPSVRVKKVWLAAADDVRSLARALIDERLDGAKAMSDENKTTIALLIQKI